MTPTEKLRQAAVGMSNVLSAENENRLLHCGGLYGRRRLKAQEPDFILRVRAHELRAVIMAELETGGGW